MDTVQLTPQLRRLRLSGMLETLEARDQQAIAGQVSYLDFLSLLLTDEVERRTMKQFNARLKRAGCSGAMTLASFDFGFNATINRQQVLDLMACRWIARQENVFLIGPAGVGKTHLACALAHAACRAGHEVVIMKASAMLRHVSQGRADGSWETRIGQYLKPALLVLDDWGLKTFDRAAADALYEIIAERYEKGSLVVTSNRALEEWPELFGDALLASAAMDRLVHHAHVLTIEGRSYRARNVVAPVATTDELPRRVKTV